MSDSTFPGPPLPGGRSPHDIGPGFLDGLVEQHIADQMKAWFPWYLHRFDELARAAGQMITPEATKIPEVYVSSDEDRWPEQTPPALIVVCPGSIPGQSELKDGRRGQMSSWLTVNLVVTAGGSTVPGTRRICQRLVAATREILAHKTRGPGSPIDRIDRMTWRYDLLTQKRRYLAGAVTAAVRVPDVLSMHATGEQTPPGDPTDPQTFPVPTGTRVRVRREPPEL
jgi:hypothetical protein